MKSNRTFLSTIVVLLAVFVIHSVSEAQVSVVRSGKENPVVTIGKSTLYGAGTGLLLGIAFALVLEEDTGDIMRWSFVAGTFGGFMMGVYHVANRPQPSTAMLQFNSTGRPKVSIPQPQLRLDSDRAIGVKFNLVSVSL